MITRKFRKATVAEKDQMRHAFLQAVLKTGEASTDDAHALYELPDDVEPRTWGAVTGGLQAEGLIRRTGETHTHRKIAHGRRVGRHAVADAAKARQHCERLAASAGRKRATQQTLFDRED